MNIQNDKIAHFTNYNDYKHFPGKDPGCATDNIMDKKYIKKKLIKISN